MRSSTILALAVLAVVAVGNAQAACNNITGTCLPQGFVCANQEVVSHEKRCNGVEDCADGTDEFMCHTRATMPLHEMPEHVRNAHAQSSCIKCNCIVNTMNLVSSHPWWPYAKVAPLTMAFLTSPASNAGKVCNPQYVSQIQMVCY